MTTTLINSTIKIIIIYIYNFDYNPILFGKPQFTGPHVVGRRAKIISYRASGRRGLHNEKSIDYSYIDYR